MRRAGALALVLTALLPLAAAAQKRPSNSMHTRSAEVYLDRAKSESNAADRQRALEQAIEVLTRGADADADNPRIWFLMGQAYTRLGDVAGADSSFDRAERLWPDYAAETAAERLDLWIRSYNAGVGAIQAGDINAAITSFEAADAIYRGRPDALVSLGSLYSRSGDLPKAEKAYRDALEVAAATAPKAEGEVATQIREHAATAAAQLAGLLRDQGKHTEAAAVIGQMAEAQPDNVGLQVEYAGALVRAGDIAKATTIYERLLGRQDLLPGAWFDMGIGLYGAEQPALAARAFRRASEGNPQSHDALYNLGQSLYATTSQMDEARAGATSGPRVDSLRAAYQELLATAEKLRGMDPNNRNVLMMAAHAQRSLGELMQGPDAESLRAKVLETLQAAEGLTFEVSGVSARFGEEQVTLQGRLTNNTLTAGTPVRLEFTFLDIEGREVGRHTVTVTAPEAGGSASFQAEVATSGPAAGWRYTGSS